MGQRHSNQITVGQQNQTNSNGTPMVQVAAQNQVNTSGSSTLQGHTFYVGDQIVTTLQERPADDDHSSIGSSMASAFKFHYDVFLSFRGIDTLSFTQRLFDELEKNHINAFFDRERLRGGEEIDPALNKAIEDSAIFIAIISENYATSKWCLDELSKIIDCNRILLPVFYKVNPSHVRHQTGTFKKAFQIHEVNHGKNDSGRIHRWKNAMGIAGRISGLESTNYKEESQLIQCLVKRILDRKESNTYSLTGQQETSSKLRGP